MTETPMSVPGYLTLVLEKAAGDVLDERAIYEISKNTAIEYASVFAESDLSEERQDPDADVPEQSKPKLATPAQVVRMKELQVKFEGVQQKFKVKRFEDLTESQANTIITMKEGAIAKQNATPNPTPEGGAQ